MSKIYVKMHIFHDVLITMVAYIDLYGFPEFNDINVLMVVHVFMNLYGFPDVDDIKEKNVSMVVHIDICGFPDFDNIMANVPMVFNH